MGNKEKQKALEITFWVDRGLPRILKDPRESLEFPSRSLQLRSIVSCRNLGSDDELPPATMTSDTITRANTNCGLELHGIKIDWSTVNASKAINRYSMSEKEKARKELWRMQVKFDGELCEAVDPDSKKRRRTPSKPTPNKRPHETSGNTELPVGVEDEPTNLSSGEAPSNQQPTPDKGKAVVEDEPTRLDPNLATKMEKARVKEATRRSLEQDLLTVPGFPVNDHGESSGQEAKATLIALAHLGLQQKWRKQPKESMVGSMKCFATS
ncbi:hypothetical protein R1sor_022719 [Riccia sorocarpa]|uniref:Uncharacterized protein n=1 Tax=Riccia sorocarpa TaxID=122646 RepID=A0ABD3GLD5_9MARC